MDSLDLNKVTCRICITGDELDGLSNVFTKKINETSGDATKSIVDDYVLNLRLSDALETFTCIELHQDRGLPETICTKCEFQLLETLSFIHRTNETQQILNSYAHNNQETKIKIEDIDVTDNSYLIEVLNAAGEVIQNEHTTKSSVPSVESNNDNEQSSECDAEDAVSFLKSVKREGLACNTSESFGTRGASENFSCNYCQKTFLRKPNLVDHMRIHANVRPYKCTCCDKSFPHSANLKSHLRTHSKKQKLPETTYYRDLVPITEPMMITQPMKATKKSTSQLLQPSIQPNDSMLGVLPKQEVASKISSEKSDSSTFWSTPSAIPALDYRSSSDDTQTSVHIDTSESTKPKRRRLPRIKRNWKLHQRFKNGDDAKEFVKCERIWSIATTNQTGDGIKVLYRCNKAKGRGRQCESAIYLLYLLESDAVLLFRTQNEHTCQSNPSMYKPMPEELKAKIFSMYKNGIRKRNEIQTILASENIEIPSTNRLNHFIYECRQKYRKTWF